METAPGGVAERLEHSEAFPERNSQVPEVPGVQYFGFEESVAEERLGNPEAFGDVLGEFVLEVPAWAWGSDSGSGLGYARKVRDDWVESLDCVAAVFEAVLVVVALEPL